MSLSDQHHEQWHLPHDDAHHPRHTARWLLPLIGLTILYFMATALHDGVQKRRQVAHDARLLTQGEPRRGRDLLRPFGCAGCHTIPGVEGADGEVGPPLGGIARRMYVGGVVTNTPDHMVQWLMNPKGIDPKTAMPDVGLSESQARDVAAYLYTLR
jgi:cytochrome c